MYTNMSDDMICIAFAVETQPQTVNRSLPFPQMLGDWPIAKKLPGLCIFCGVHKDPSSQIRFKKSTQQLKVSFDSPLSPKKITQQKSDGQSSTSCATNQDSTTSRTPVLELSPTSAEPITSLCPSLKDPQRYAIYGVETHIFPAPDLVTPADHFDCLPPAPSASVPDTLLLAKLEI